jgi:homoserine O-acetyltransferase
MTTSRRGLAPPGARLFRSADRLPLHYGGELSGFQLAYETWGEPSPDRDNAILICTGLSASSHARSHEADPSPGWWEGMIGPGAAIDTDRFFVVCSNVLGGCFGSTGPASTDPETGTRYNTGFPIVSIWDMVEAQMALLDHLGIRCLDTAVGASMGGMQTLALGAAHPQRTRRIVAISSPGRSYPLSISLRHVQREAVMMDPAWRNGDYAPAPGPARGLHLARQIGTITYRSGPEWDRRFARERKRERPVDFDIDFEIESYLRHQGDRFVDRFDANSYLYLSKSMDLFDLGEGAASYDEGVSRIRARTLLVGVTTDLLFPIHQQEEVARSLRDSGRDCRFVRLDSVYGHDAFLIEVDRFGRILRSFLDEPAGPQAAERPDTGPMGDWGSMAGG